jgi:ribosomal protein S27E
MKIRVKLKRDRFSARRGGGSKLLDIFCARCGNVVIVYQKDGPGPLLRCYVDRIVYPVEYSHLHKSKEIRLINDLPRLTCNDCGAVIGIPTRYKEHGEDRLAFNVLRLAFKKKMSDSVGIK